MGNGRVSEQPFVGSFFLSCLDIANSIRVVLEDAASQSRTTFRKIYKKEVSDWVLKYSEAVEVRIGLVNQKYIEQHLHKAFRVPTKKSLCSWNVEFFFKVKLWS